MGIILVTTLIYTAFLLRKVDPAFTRRVINFVVYLITLYVAGAGMALLELWIPSILSWMSFVILLIVLVVCVVLFMKADDKVVSSYDYKKFESREHYGDDSL